MHVRNDELRLMLSDMMLRMVAGIEHLAEIARQWEPDHSSHTDRRGHHTRPADRLAADN